ncbi:MAG: tRNA glutamyl-Q(34) synthetase GluQRS [Treponema sp.]|nr:tRNA glutamyl-Q(34) synthetase GluQRS [Treponema sp.]
MRYYLTMQKGRFAPSPSGRMHLGNVYAALISWLSVKKEGGSWLLRIEDLDRQRCKREWANQLMDDLAWLGLEWDEGPKIEGCAKSVGDGADGWQDQKSAPSRSPADSYFQSERDAIYKKYFERLEAQGLIYDCFCRRADLTASSAPHAGDGTPIYAGTCRKLSPAERERLLKERAPAKRIRVDARQSVFVDGHYGEQKCDLERDCGDFVLRRADKNFSYQLAVTVDDALMGVTQVARGRDLLASTHQQLFLYEKLGFAAPQFYHFPLLVDKQGRRLCKRDKDLDMAVLRANYTPQKIIGKIMALCGFVARGAQLTPADALEVFDWERLPKEDIVVE